MLWEYYTKKFICFIFRILVYNPTNKKLDNSNFNYVTGLNIVFRKLASAATPTVEFVVEDGIIKMISKVSFFNQVLTFDLENDHVQSFEGSEMKVNIIGF